MANRKRPIPPHGSHRIERHTGGGNVRGFKGLCHGEGTFGQAHPRLILQCGHLHSNATPPRAGDTEPIADSELDPDEVEAVVVAGKETGVESSLFFKITKYISTKIL